MSRLGVLDDLQLQPATRRSPGPDEIEVEVCAVGLNLREVLKALDVYSGDEVEEVGSGGTDLCLTFDGDCAGRVVRVGDNVSRFRVGDEVVGLGFDVFGSFAILPAGFTALKPPHLSFEEAATIPVVFMTAYWALHRMGRIQKGERVLIHAAAGGVGLAAVQLCQRVGAEVFATAGSEEKRAFLRQIGVRHVMDSRSLNFVDDIMRITQGAGVDVVLNALSGEFIPKSLSLLAPLGRFLEIGKKDIYANNPLFLYPFRNNLSFFAIDLLKMTPAMIGGILDEVMHYFERGEFKPLHYRAFPIAETASAFRYMRRANHIGKIVISVEDAVVPVQGH